MAQTKDFTKGKILGPLVRFAVPVLFALFLQAMYGAVDLMVVGRFATSADVSAVATGSQIVLTFTGIVTAFSMGATILLGQQLGSGEGEKGGRTVGACIALFSAVGVALTSAAILSARGFTALMQAPVEAFDLTVTYTRICGGGLIIIIAYNLLGSIFRGLGDSTTPLIAVAIACVVNIAADLLFIAGFGWGTAGAAMATVLAQGVSVILSLLIIRKKQLPFRFSRKDIHWDSAIIKRITKLGLPLAMQDLLVGASFLILQAIVNSLGLIPSAGIGVAEKVCAFIMLVSAAFMQGMAAFVSQNAGTKRYDRATRALWYGIGLSLAVGVVMFYISFFHGDILAGIFSRDPEVIAAGADYLKAYAIDCIFTSFLFVFVGYFDGLGMTRFAMTQSIIGALGVRVPVSYLMSRIKPVSLFRIGLATPCSTVLQITLCLLCMIYVKKKIIDPSKRDRAQSDSVGHPV